MNRFDDERRKARWAHFFEALSPEERREFQKAYYEDNKAHVRAVKRKYYQYVNREKVLEKRKREYQENAVVLRQRSKEYRLNNPEKRKITSDNSNRKYYSKNKNSLLLKMKEYRANNAAKLKVYRDARKEHKAKIDKARYERNKLKKLEYDKSKITT